MESKVFESEKTSDVKVEDSQKEVGKQSRGKTGKQGLVPPDSGFVNVLKRAVQDLETQVFPERRFYAINFPAIASTFSSFEEFVRLQPRRGGWLHVGYYSGACWFSLAAKLQRIGVATEQIPSPGASLLQVSHMSLPSVIQLVVDQFGIKKDSNGIEYVPNITEGLLRSIVSLSLRLMDGDHADHAAVIANASGAARELFRTGYGLDWFDQYCFCGVASILHVPYSVFRQPGTEALKLMWYSIIASTRFTNGNAAITTAQAAALLPDGPARSPASAYFAVGGGAPAAGDLITAAIRDAIRAVIAASVAPFNPFLNGGVFDTLVGRTRVPVSAVRWQNEQHQLSLFFPMKEVSVNTEGSFAPIVTALDDQGAATASTSVRGLMPAEWVLGCVLGSFEVICTEEGLILNMSHEDARRRRYTIGHLYTDISDLRAAVWREGLIAKK